MLYFSRALVTVYFDKTCPHHTQPSSPPLFIGQEQEMGVAGIPGDTVVRGGKIFQETAQGIGTNGEGFGDLLQLYHVGAAHLPLPFYLDS